MSGLNITAQRAREVADAIDAYDEQIKDLQDGKRETFASLRAELEDLGLDRANIRDEMAALKAAIVKRAKRRTDADAVDERDAMTDSYLDLIERSAARATHAIATAVPNGSATEHQPARSSAERDPQSAKHGPDSGGGAGLHKAGSGQESAEEPQARNEPGSGGAASGGAGVTARPETPDADAPIKGLAAANAIAARAAQPTAPKVDRAEIDIEIPAFLRRTNGGNHPSFGEQA
jgi:hypothetical protein